jgi:O-antigen/teichoic acid export membrane protein
MFGIIRRFRKHIGVGIVLGGSVLVLIATFKLIEHYYGTVVLGGFSLINVFVQMGGIIAGLGVPTLLLKKVSGRAAFSVEYSYYVEKLVGYGFSISVIHSICYMITLFLANYFLVAIFPEELGNLSVGLALSCSLFYGLTLLFSEIVRATGHQIRFQILQGFFAYLVFCILIICDFRIRTFDNLIVLFFISQVITAVVALQMFHKTGLRLRMYMNRKWYKMIVRSSTDYFYIKVLQYFANWTTIILTTYMISQEDAAGMNIVLKYVSFGSFVVSIINTIAAPLYSQYFKSNDLQKLNESIKQNNQFIVFLNLPILVGLFVLAPELLAFFSPDLVRMSAVFRILIFMVLINNLCGGSGMLMQMTNNQSVHRNVLATSLLIYALIAPIWCYYFGVIGLGIALLTHAVIWNCYELFYLRRTGILSYFRF